MSGVWRASAIQEELRRSGAPRDPLSYGMIAGLLTPVLMGFAPIFGKLTIQSGTDPYTLAALRTSAAAAVLWIVYLIFFRKYVYIYPAGLLGTMAVGAVNGLGSLLYYNGLLLLGNASLAQLLNMLYVLFVMLLTRFYGGEISRMNIVRAILAMLAVYFLTAFNNQAQGQVHWMGVGLMVGSAFMYAYHAVLSQRSMYEMPAPTMALYALTWMALTVVAARLFLGTYLQMPWGPVRSIGWMWLFGLTLVTAMSRVTLFAGVRRLGVLPTILLNVLELGVTLLAGYIFLNEVLTLHQWVGVLILLASVILSRWDRPTKDIADVSMRVPNPFGGFRFDEPLTPGKFSTISKIYRRKSRTEALKEVEGEGK